MAQAPCGRPLTPMLRQYQEAKGVYPEALLLFRMGDFYELFFDDAKVAAETLELTLTARDKGPDAVPMAGVPHHAVGGYIARLVERGHSVAVCDQLEDPTAARGLVRRAVTRLVTPGTVAELDVLDAQATCYLAAAELEPGGGWAAVLLDLLAGEMVALRASGRLLGDELTRLGAREVLVDGAQGEPLRRALGARPVWVRDGVMPRPPPTGGGIDELWRRHFGPASPPWAALAAPAAGALAAAWGRLVTFAEATQQRPLTHLMPPRMLAAQEALGLDEATRRNLELCQTTLEGRRQGSLLALLDACRTSMGSRLLRRWLLRPLVDRAGIARRADSVACLKRERSRRREASERLRAVRDIERLMGRVALGRANPRDALALARSLAALPALQAGLAAADCPLGAAWRGVDLAAPLAARLAAALVDEPPLAADGGGVFRRGFCPVLDELMALTEEGERLIAELAERERRQTGIGSLKVRAHRVFGTTFEVTRANLAQVPAGWTRRQTLAGGERFVTPALTALEARLVDAQQQRCLREQQAFAALLAEVAAAMGPLRRIGRMVATSDVLIALAEVADVHRWARPTLVDEPVLELTGSRHPVIEALMPGGERFVANDIRLGGAGRRLLVVTGPNMAGKSTAMRQAGLAVVLAQMGSFVPASAAVVGLCDQLFTRVGAGEDLGRGMSTFMVEMSETASILARATAGSLVLIDEIGRGTSTYDGLSIAWAVAEHLAGTVGCRAMFATHYHELAGLAAELPMVANISAAAGEQGGRIVFLRRLVEGPAAHSYGVQVAELAGLPGTVLARARTLLAELEAGRPVSTAPRAAAAPRAGLPSTESLLAAALAALDLDEMSPRQCAEALRRLQGQAGRDADSRRSA